MKEKKIRYLFNHLIFLKRLWTGDRIYYMDDDSHKNHIGIVLTQTFYFFMYIFTTSIKNLRKNYLITIVTSQKWSCTTGKQTWRHCCFPQNNFARKWEQMLRRVYPIVAVCDGFNAKATSLSNGCSMWWP